MNLIICNYLIIIICNYLILIPCPRNNTVNKCLRKDTFKWFQSTYIQFHKVPTLTKANNTSIQSDCSNHFCNEQQQQQDALSHEQLSNETTERAIIEQSTAQASINSINSIKSINSNLISSRNPNSCRCQHNNRDSSTFVLNRRPPGNETRAERTYGIELWLSSASMDDELLIAPVSQP